MRRRLVVFALLGIMFVSLMFISIANAEDGESFIVYTDRDEYSMGDTVNVFAKATTLLPDGKITLTDVIVYDPLNDTVAEWNGLSVVLSDTNTEVFVGSLTATEAGYYTVDAAATGCILRCFCRFRCWSRMHNIKIVPEGSTHTGEPLVTDTPADLLVYSRGHSPIKNVWLLMVMDENTYNNLASITTTLGVTVPKSDFKLVTTFWLPPYKADPPYPGSYVRYRVSAIKDKIGTTGKVYYAVVPILDEITTAPTAFTLTVNLNTPTQVKVLLLGLGRYNRRSTDCILPFNEGSAYSNSTIVVPELETILLIAAPLSALGLYVIKRKRK
jgi:hypothetical protein